MSDNSEFRRWGWVRGGGKIKGKLTETGQLLLFKLLSRYREKSKSKKMKK